MSIAYKMSFQDMPELVTVPTQFQHKKVEVILMTEDNHIDKYPSDFFDRCVGSIPDLEREEQGLHEERNLW